jgi:hypothetical protein
MVIQRSWGSSKPGELQAQRDPLMRPRSANSIRTSDHDLGRTQGRIHERTRLMTKICRKPLAPAGAVYRQTGCPKEGITEGDRNGRIVATQGGLPPGRLTRLPSGPYPKGCLRPVGDLRDNVRDHHVYHDGNHKGFKVVEIQRSGQL